jgi:hypothetical protein
VPLVDFSEQFPNFQLEDKLLLQGGRDVMYDRTFDRHKNRVLQEQE